MKALLERAPRLIAEGTFIYFAVLITLAFSGIVVGYPAVTVTQGVNDSRVLVMPLSLSIFNALWFVYRSGSTKQQSAEVQANASQNL